MSAVIVFPKPLRGVVYKDLGGANAVTVLALAGSTLTGWQEDRTALVVDEYGNLSWIDTDGLGITEFAPSTDTQVEKVRLQEDQWDR